MPDLKISQLTDQATPPGTTTFVPVVNDALANRKVTLQNVVKAGIAAGNVGLATVATSGSYTDLSNKPTQSLAQCTDVDLTGNAAGSVLRYNGTTWTPQPETTLLDGGNF